MSSAALLVGLVLTFGRSDASALQLTVSLAEPATVALDWGGLPRSSTTAQQRHIFRDLPAPTQAKLVYRLRVSGQPERREEVAPLLLEPLKVGLYGDSRDGPGPHQALVAGLGAWQPSLVIHTGDIVNHAGDQAGWSHHLAASLPLSARVPIILSLGNHELWQPWDRPAAERLDAVGEILAQVPPPEDPLARRFGVGPQVFHVRVGRHLFVSLDSNAPIGAGSPQLQFLEAALAEGPADTALVSLHHGPLSSGPHGGHPEGAALIELAERYGVTAVLSGHDHIYERLVRGSVTYLVSGGGGAPLYERRGYELGSLAFASTYNWVGLTLQGKQLELSAHSLEGVLLDQAELPATTDASAVAAARLPWAWAGLGVLVLTLVYTLWSLALARRTRSG